MRRHVALVLAALLVLATVGFFVFRGCGSKPSTDHAPGPSAPANTPTTDPGTPRDAARPPVTARAADGGPATVAATAADAAPPPEGFLDDPADCEDVCGSECQRDHADRLRCPPLCDTDADCGAGTSCSVTRMPLGGGHAFRCLAAECQPGPGQARGCPAGSNCVLRGRSPAGQNLFRCSAGGDRQAGEACADLDYARLGRCAAGLDCLAGRCYPTTCTTASDCPAGSACRRYDPHDATQRLCSPDCDAETPCPSGERCVAVGTTNLCVAADQPKSCLETGCAAGETCLVDHAVSWDLQARCAVTCLPAGAPEAAPACPAGQFCGRTAGAAMAVTPFRCYAPCANNDACPAHFACQPITKTQSACVYSPIGTTDAYFTTHPEGK